MVGQVRSGKIVPYQTAVNVQVLLVYEGEHTLAATFKAAHYTHKLTTWAYRFGGWLLLFFAITCTSSLLQSLRKFYKLTISFQPTFFLFRLSRFSFTKPIFLVGCTRSKASSQRKPASFIINCANHNVNSVDISTSLAGW